MRRIEVVEQPCESVLFSIDKVCLLYTSGTVKQEIKIYYKFIGFVDELHIIPTKRWAAMPAKNCTVCGVEYVPGLSLIHIYGFPRAARFMTLTKTGNG